MRRSGIRASSARRRGRSTAPAGSGSSRCAQSSYVPVCIRVLPEIRGYVRDASGGRRGACASGSGHVSRGRPARRCGSRGWPASGRRA
ncbi:hypothetical protein ACFFX0_03660 [Citricoccus parietis]|uniref:Uncharacterized protein n=1 Tax=Citricoccus parietis TaxID=592307 RepID=A0ABV5FUI6_9MICC